MSSQLVLKPQQQLPICDHIDARFLENNKGAGLCTLDVARQQKREIMDYDHAHAPRVGFRTHTGLSSVDSFAFPVYCKGITRHSLIKKVKVQRKSGSIIYTIL